MLKRKRILVAPLDWGLGHATRCIPVIRELISQNAEVIVGAHKIPLQLLRKEFPDLEYIEFPGVTIRYTTKSNMFLKLAFQAGHFLQSISEENTFLQELIKNYAIDAVISDNRYGAYSKMVPSIIITHQLFIRFPFGSYFLDKLLFKYISNFDECWIPDAEFEPSLSGMLSHKQSLPEHCHFIHPLSRFKPMKVKKPKRKLLIILSGPEPTRTSLEEKILDQLKNINYQVLLVRGIPHNLNVKKLNENIEIRTILTSDELEVEIQNSEIVLCRSGYSSIMDLAVIGKKAILIPTKGQTEQEYLAAKMKKEKKCYSCAEEDLDLKKAIDECNRYSGLYFEINKTYLKNKIADLLSYS